MDLPDLNFQPGVGVQAAIRARFGEPVNYFPIGGLKEFFLLVSFGRCKYRLTEQSVGYILQATLGGVAIDFRSQQISDRVFKFVVASKQVGFHIYNLRSYSCDQYQIYFNLWSNGGAHWSLEVEKFNREKEDQWTTVQSRRNKRRSYAEVLKTNQKVSGANAIPIGSRARNPRVQVCNRPSVFERIRWPRQTSFTPRHRPRESMNRQPAMERAKNKVISRDERDPEVQISKSQAKGKQPLEGPTQTQSLCLRCAKSRLLNTPCKDWIICYACHRAGHIALHCSAQWRKSQPKQQPKQPPQQTVQNLESTERRICIAKKAQAGGASGSKKSILEDLITQQPGASSPASNTELQLSTRSQNPVHCSSPSPPLQSLPSSSSGTMAFQRADPRPFAPHGFQPMEVQYREPMVRAVARFSPPTHEDFAIVSIAPLPDNVLQFSALHQVVHEFLEDHMNVRVREIQPSHLGQALVRFVHAHDRDLLVNQSPHPYGGVEFHLVRHNQGRNWRAMYFNHECWLMLLGFPLDYWNHDSIQGAIASFGRVILWENDRRHLARLLVRARVTDLQAVPHFLVLTEAEGFNGQSWTVQCEILEQHILEEDGAAEDPVPEMNNMGQPPLFDFFGLGQPMQGPKKQDNLEEPAQNQQGDWDPWFPTEEDELNIQDAENNEGDLLQAEAAEQNEMVIDLNLAPEAEPEEDHNIPIAVAALPDLNIPDIEVDNHHLPAEAQVVPLIQNVIIEQNAGSAPISMELDISAEISSENEVEQMLEEDHDEVLALPVAPFNFLHLQIQPHELDAAVPDLNMENNTVTIGPDLDVTSELTLHERTEGAGDEGLLLGNSQDQVAVQGDPQQENEQQGHGDEHNNLQVGMVLLPDTLEVDPGLQDVFGSAHMENDWVPKQNAEGVRIWAKHFAPIGQADGIQIPHSWTDFFTLALMNPTRFEWAKNFLGSNAWKIILKDRNSEATITFSMPRTCPDQDRPQCTSQLEETSKDVESEDELTPQKSVIQPQASVSTSAMHRKRKNIKAPLVVSDVRRSERLKGKTNGFKSAPCPSKNCLCCAAEPPTLSTKVIRRLGQEFCKISPEVISEAALKKKPSIPRAAGPKNKKDSKAEKTNKPSKDVKPRKRNKKE